MRQRLISTGSRAGRNGSMSSPVAVKAAGSRLSTTEVVLNADGESVRRPRQALTLIEKMLLRAGGHAAGALVVKPKPVEGPRKRGRPRKNAP